MACKEEQDNEKLVVIKTRLSLMYNKAKLLSNGDKWEYEISQNLELDSPYR